MVEEKDFTFFNGHDCGIMSCLMVDDSRRSRGVRSGGRRRGSGGSGGDGDGPIEGACLDLFDLLLEQLVTQILGAPLRNHVVQQ